MSEKRTALLCPTQPGALINRRHSVASSYEISLQATQSISGSHREASVGVGPARRVDLCPLRLPCAIPL